MRLIFIVFLFFIALTNSLFAQEERNEKANDFVIHNSLFVLYHEIGHLIISELDIPILGREENAADNFATLELLKIGTKEANNLLIDAANGWFLSAKESTSEYISQEQFYGEHSLDVQRAYQIVCLMVGKDKEIFKQAADDVGLDPLRQESCYYEYLLAQESWEKVLKPYINQEPKDIELRAIYDRVTGNLLLVRKLLQENRLLEDAIEGVLREYRFPNKFNLRAKNCGEANAFYDSWTSELLFCYELADFFFSIFDENSLAIKVTIAPETKQEILTKIKEKNKKDSGADKK